MSDREWTPEEFERLVALPEDAPERLALADDARFQARLLLLREFEGTSHALPGDAGATAAAAELLRRVLPASEPRQRSVTRVRWRARTWNWALAAAAAILVVGGTWWFRAPQSPGEPTRGSETSGTLAWTTVTENVQGIELAWTPVRGADHYRLAFYGPTQNELARLDSLATPMAELEHGALPAGLVPGSEVLAEISALRGADVLATSPPRAIHVR